jgi:DNA replication protein DnaC
MQTELTKRLAYELGLYGMHGHLEARLKQAMADSQHPAELLNLLFEDEKLFRKDRLSKSLSKRAKFRHEAVLEDWDQSYDRGVTKTALKELFSLEFMRAQENLILLGRTGEGKTQLAISLGKKICDTGMSVGFYSVNMMFEELIAARTAGRFLGFINKIRQTKVLILDDFALRNYTHEEANVLVEILESRVKRGPIIITSQVDPKGWTKLFEDPVIAEAIVDRMAHPAQTMQLKGGSYRDRLRKKN